MHKSFPYVLVALATLMLSCNPPGANRPNEAGIVESGLMPIYGAFKSSDATQGKYEYWVRDGSGNGCILFTDKEYKAGDLVEIVVHPAPLPTPEKP